MSGDATMIYESLYRLASENVEGELFGTSAPLALEAFQRALAGKAVPIVWFEVPFSDAPRFDLHVAHSNADLHKDAPFAPEAMDGHGELLNWYASKPREGGGLALAYDVGVGRIEKPALHANVNDAGDFDVEGFFTRVGRADATALYDSFASRLPQGWHVWYFGVHPGRPGTPVRVDCFIDKALKQAYATDPAKLKEDLSKAGFSDKGSQALRIGAKVAASPFGMELQFDVLSNGEIVQTVGISARLPLGPTSMARPYWEPCGDVTQLMEFAEELKIADARWRHVQDAMFTTMVPNGTVLLALYCVPVFVKFRVRDGAPLDAKVYLEAGAKELCA